MYLILSGLDVLLSIDQTSEVLGAAIQRPGFGGLNIGESQDRLCNDHAPPVVTY
jgi:hypothetical protein